MRGDSAWPLAVLGPFHPYRGGIAHHSTLLVRSLLADHPVMGLNFARLYPGLLFPGRTQYDDSADPLRAAGVATPRCIDSIGPWTWRRAAQRVVDFEARLLILQWWHPFFAPAYAAIATQCRRRGVRTLFLCHNVLPHESSRIDGALVRWALRSADAFIVQSQGDVETLQQLAPDKPVELTPHPAYNFFRTGSMSREQARAQLRVQGDVLLFFGLIRQYKGLDVLLRALALVRQQLPVRLMVVGEFYQDRRPYDALIAELQLGDAVHIVDRYLPNEEVEPWFLAADLVVMPYRSATQSGIAQISLSFERPVLVTRVGGLPEVVEPGRTGMVVHPEDAPAMAAAIVDFFQQRRQNEMQPFLAGAAERFSWDNMVHAVHRSSDRLGLPTP
jgi:glycosyltransferase involved in cell wall biosynthesis